MGTVDDPFGFAQTDMEREALRRMAAELGHVVSLDNKPTSRASQTRTWRCTCGQEGARPSGAQARDDSLGHLRRAVGLA